MFRFYNRNASSIRAIMIADCLPHSETAATIEIPTDANQILEAELSDNFTRGNPVSHRDLNALPCTLPSASDLGKPFFFSIDFHNSFSPHTR